MKYKSYTLKNYRKIPQIANLPDHITRSIEVVGNVLPFKVNNYVLDELIDWSNYESDPIYHLTFPQRDMLKSDHYEALDHSLNTDTVYFKKMCDSVRNSLNPHPSGQLSHNIPNIDGVPLWGVQHKYRETVLFFPKKGQSCHSYCTFCFRWPQFVGIESLKFAMREHELLIKYLENHQEVTDLLFTGGDPMVINYKNFQSYINPFLSEHNKTNIQTIRIGTKALSFWPYKFITDNDADDFLNLFEKIVRNGINLAIMAHFSHPRELETNAVKEAIRRIRSTGAQIRTQSPVLKHINDSPDIWSEMWRKQVNLNCIPYYMFIARITGAQHYFALTLIEAWDIWRKAYQNVSGVCRTVRGPSMSCTPGKIQFLGVSEINNEKVFVLRFIQGRNPNWVARPFFAKYDESAIWMNSLKPAFSDKFFFEEEEEILFHEKFSDEDIDSFE